MTKIYKRKWTEEQLKKQRAYGKIGGKTKAKNQAKIKKKEEKKRKILENTTEIEMQKMEKEMMDDPKAFLQKCGIPAHKVSAILPEFEKLIADERKERIMAQIMETRPEVGLILQYFQVDQKEKEKKETIKDF